MTLSRYAYSLSVAAVIALVGCSSEPEPADIVEANPAPTQVAEAAPAGPPAGAPPGGMDGPPRAGGMGGPPAPPPAEPIPDIDPSLVELYKTIGDVELSAYVFYPEGHSADSSAPALIYFHGGGLRHGSPEQGYALAERFIPEGVVVISPQYRLLETNADSLDQVVADAKSVVRWARANADRLGINPNQIVASGYSAGGYLSMTAGVIPGLDEISEDLSVSSVPSAMVLWSSGTTRRDDLENSIVPEGRTITDFSVPEELANDLPPALFIHGDQDPIASPEVALAFEENYREAGNQSSFYMIEGADHFFAGEGQKGQVYDLIEEFLISLGYLEGQ